MGAPLDKSHPEVVEEIRRLAKEGKTITQIKVAVKEKFNHSMIGRTIKGWAGVDFDTQSGRPISPEKREQIRVLMSGDDAPTTKEAAKIFGVSEKSITTYRGTIAQYLTAEQWAEKYPDLRDKLLSDDKGTVTRAKTAASQRRQRETRRAILSAAEESKFDPLTDKQMRRLAKDKAIRVLKNQRTRALLYRISPEPDPSSFLSYSEYNKLDRSGNAPKILGRVYMGDFSTDSVKAMKKMVEDEVYSFLKKGGNPNSIPLHFGHILAMKGVDPETNKRFLSGLTNLSNIQMQDAYSNMRQTNKIPKELLRGLGYHAPGFMGLVLAGLAAPWGEAKADPWIKFAAEATTGLDVDRAISDPSRLRPGRIGATIAEDTIVPIGQMIAGGLSAENIPQEPYYGMGRQRGLLDTGHPGIGRERQKRRTNIWT